MVRIQLTKDRYAIVDDCDQDLNQFLWLYSESNDCAFRWEPIPKSNKYRAVYLRKVIGQRKYGKKINKFWSKDRNSLNCTRDNITKRQNDKVKPTLKVTGIPTLERGIIENGQ